MCWHSSRRPYKAILRKGPQLKLVINGLIMNREFFGLQPGCEKHFFNLCNILGENFDGMIQLFLRCVTRTRYKQSCQNVFSEGTCQPVSTLWHEANVLL